MSENTLQETILKVLMVKSWWCVMVFVVQTIRISVMVSIVCLLF